MDLRQLRYFAAIAAAQSLSKASSSAGVSQSALTRQLQLLEEELGVPLLARTGHGVVLTEAGERFLSHAKEILERADSSVREMQALRATPAGTVVLGIPPMLGEPLLVPLVTRFHRDFPEVSLRIREAISGYTLEWLLTGQVDVAVLYNAPRRANISTEPLIQDEMMLVGAAHHGVMDVDTPVDLADALRLPLVLPSPLHGQRGIVEAAAAGLSMRPNIKLEVDGMGASLRFVEEGFGYTFLPFGSVASRVARGLLGVRPIVNPSVPSTLSIAMSTQRPTTQAMKALFRYIDEEVAQLLKTRVWQTHKPGGAPGPDAS